LQFGQIYKSNSKGGLGYWTDYNRPISDYGDGNGNLGQIEIGRKFVSLGLNLSFSDASKKVDYRTLRNNLFLSYYIGPWNPKKNNGEWDYSVAPQNRADMYAFVHDKKYDRLRITGAGGVFFNTKAISADYSLVASEFSLFLAPPISPISPTERVQGFIVGVAIGVAALPKTIVHGVNQIIKAMPANTFPGL